MRVAVIGGKLQGIEACYLARRAGWETVLIDKNPAAPATGLCDDFVCLDVLSESDRLAAAIHKVDLVIPALENRESLQLLAEFAAQSVAPVALDPEAYAITSSKKQSDDLFSRLGISAPRRWPDCELPVMVKPVGSSGSKGVIRIDDQEVLDRFLDENPSHSLEWVIQEYVEGPSYSLEVIGLDGEAVTLQTTGLGMDAAFDCKRVLAPAHLSPTLDDQFREIATTLAQTLCLKGVMDVEVVFHDGCLKVLEIDARLPSQTPTVVERSSGINMLELLREVFIESRLPQVSLEGVLGGVVYEHVRVSGSRLEISGERIMAGAGPLQMATDFFGADVALTDFRAPDRPWVATLIMSDESIEGAWAKRLEVIHTIMDACNLTDHKD
jgi:pyrrolysine biosynthesis protein PylC